MTPQELDEIMEIHWPLVVRRVMEDDSDQWVKGFVLSILRYAKRPSWRPSPKQERVIRQLMSDLGTAPQHMEVIER